MNLNYYENELPDRQTLSQLDSAECAAIAQLLELMVHVDDVLTQEEIDTLRRTFALLPGIDTEFANRVMEGNEFFASQQYVEDYPSRIREIVAPLKSESSKIAALRLAAIVSTSDGLDSSEIALYDMIVEALNYDMRLADDFLRSAWDTKQNTNEEILPIAS